MFGVRYLKVRPTTHVIHFRKGKVVRDGAGLSFFYFSPNSDIVSVPLASTDVPFVFNEVTEDFQDATIQGELTYRIADPKRVASTLDFSVDRMGRYRSEDPTKLDDRLIHEAQIQARSFTQRRGLTDVLIKSAELIDNMLAGLRQSAVVRMLGIEVLSLSILSIKATPEMSKALQAGAREELLRRADEAVYARRNAAVELERTIKENELNTEIAVELKRRNVRETQMAAEIAVEQQRATLVEQRVDNERKEADSRAHALTATLEPLKGIDWRTLMAASGGDGNSRTFIASAFEQLAENAGRVGQLNITPDLLSSLMQSREK
jgi:regulator of protease activity HflC (stomatin/prohibitin superfamily)